MDFEPWKAYGTWLEGQHNEVWIPYAISLAKDIPAMHVRQRRDFKLLLNAIKTLAIMHQVNRERDHRGRIIANLTDYETARDLLNDLLSQGIGATVSQEMRDTVAAVRALTVDAEEPHTTNKAVAAKLGLDKSSVSTRINKALTDGYILNEQEKGRRGNKLCPGDPLPGESSLLPEPADMARTYINREIATVCNVVGRLDANQKGGRDSGWFGSLVGRLVGCERQTNPSVRTLEKPYSEDFGLYKPNLGDGDHSEPHEPCTPPNPVKPSNYGTKFAENVTRGDASADAQPTNQTVHPTMLQARLREFLDSNKFWDTTSFYVAYRAQQEFGGDEEELRTLVKELQRGAA